MLRFQLNPHDNTPTTNKRRSRKRAVKNKGEPLYIEVNVGTPKYVKVTLDGVLKYDCIHQGERSVLFHTVDKRGEHETLVVRWSHNNSGCDDKDDVAISTVTNQSVVPGYKAKHRFVHQGIHVSVGVRRYIHGSTLASVMKDASKEQMDHYKLQVQAMSDEFATVTSEYYGSILNAGLKASTVAGYLSARNLIEGMKSDGYTNCDVPTGPHNWNDNCKPRMCHGALWPDHVIVNGTSVEGIVGWSSADFMPESVDRYLYRLWSTRSHRHKSWREFLYSLPSSCDASTSITGTCAIIRYAESLSVSRSRSRDHDSIHNTAQKMIGRAIAGSVDKRNSHFTVPRRCSDYDDEEEYTSDQRSLFSLTELTIEAWERATDSIHATEQPCPLSSSSDAATPRPTSMVPTSRT